MQPTAPNDDPKDAKRDRVSQSLETAQTAMEAFGGNDEPVRCSCHGEEKKSQKLSLLAAVFSFCALALSAVSLALPFLKNADDVTFDAAQWQEFLTTIEARFDDASSSSAASAAPTRTTPTTYVPRPSSSAPAVVTQTPTPTPAETTEAPTETSADEPTPTDGSTEVAAETADGTTKEPATGTGAAR